MVMVDGSQVRLMGSHVSINTQPSKAMGTGKPYGFPLPAVITSSVVGSAIRTVPGGGASAWVLTACKIT